MRTVSYHEVFNHYKSHCSPWSIHRRSEVPGMKIDCVKTVNTLHNSPRGRIRLASLKNLNRIIKRNIVHPSMIISPCCLWYYVRAFQTFYYKDDVFSKIIRTIVKKQNKNKKVKWKKYWKLWLVADCWERIFFFFFYVEFQYKSYYSYQTDSKPTVFLYAQKCLFKIELLRWVQI